MSIKEIELAKRAAAKRAASFIESGMNVGLGTGSTATYFIEYLIERCQIEQLKITVAASSVRSYEQAKAGGIPLQDVNKITGLDITVDGADEIDHNKQMIKGGGGALLREKIIANMSREMVVIVDSTKVVSRFGAFPLPVEIVPFAYTATIYQITLLGFSPVLRSDPNGNLYITDNGNYIIDIPLSQHKRTPSEIQSLLKAIPGVVEIGFFLGFAGRVVVGYPDGYVDIIP